MDNHRPISLLLFSKSVDKIITGRLTDYLESKYRFSNSQFGFRGKNSTLPPSVHFGTALLNPVLTKNMPWPFSVTYFRYFTNYCRS
jgi:hypothetical protein